ncbi:MAG: UDP-N-acetylmuramoyl-tripeptide--D-alanyl-D-alanine ligase [Lentisphaeria bacterium]|nr:UDP-N-acetylmuramoyl-tripeptide--D-alanyl-D-alanine ligase [Lentisphaeria bacterium]
MAARFTADELAAAAGGTWIRAVRPDGPLEISTDTRIDNRGRIFFALRGERFDAHDYLPQAASSGCAALCLRRDKIAAAPPGIPVLAVEDTLIAYQACGAFHRRRFSELTALGVTGSVGKTSVKEMLRAIFTAAVGEDAVLCTEGNTNNQVGVVQNLLRLDPGHRFAVLEAGTSAPGEIAPLAALIRPAGAIVNAIAPCHLEKLGNLRGVAREKGELFRALPPGGVAVFPADAPEADTLRECAAGRETVTFGMDGAGEVSAVWRRGSLEGSSFLLRFPDGERREIVWTLTGEHNAKNAAGAAALALRFGIAPDVIARGLPRTILPGMRMKRTTVAGVHYLNDAYNANPASMLASLRMLAASPRPGRLILALGGMRELGPRSAAEHAALLRTAAKLLPQAELLTIGDEFAGISPRHFDSAEAAAAFLAALVRPGDTVFAKGSRGNAVERVLPPEAR